GSRPVACGSVTTHCSGTGPRCGTAGWPAPAVPGGHSRGTPDTTDGPAAVRQDARAPGNGAPLGRVASRGAGLGPRDLGPGRRPGRQRGGAVPGRLVSGPAGRPGRPGP